MLLSTRFVEQVWGCDTLPAPFTAPEKMRVGEIVFDPPPSLPDLLVKYLFTAETQPVQCQPSAQQAAAAGHGDSGSEKCWIVISAQPGALIGIGFNQPFTADVLPKAARDGTIAELMRWFEVQTGDVFTIPAGTVHAIGPGCVVVEMLRNTGAQREILLEPRVTAANGNPYDTALRKSLPASGSAMLVDGPDFRVDLVAGVQDEAQLYSYAQPLLVLPLSGEVLIAGAALASPGECAIAPDLASVTFAPDGKALVMAPL
ncbi:MAG: mannose-6-phosphate isomerase [Alteraurantiacibacter sp.]